MATAPVFRATSGLNNVLEPHRLKYGEDGGCPLAACSSIFVDNGGGIRTRFPRRLVYDGAAHSFWASGVFAFFCSDGCLYRLMADETVLLVSNAVGDEPVSFAMFMGRVHACNSTFRAIIDESNVYPWVATIPEKFSSDTRVLGFPADFSRCAVHAGRMCLIDGNKLWIGEPFYHACFDMALGPIVMESDITGFVSVETGFYVSDQSRTYFIAGGSKRDISAVIPVSPTPIIQGTEAVSPVAEVGFDRAVGNAGVWVCQDGVYVGAPDGSVRNLTEGRLVFPKITSGSACIHDGYYIFSLEVQ